MICLSKVALIMNLQDMFGIFSPIKIENKSSQVRNNVMNALFNNFGIKCALQFFPLYKYDLFKENGYGNADCPNLEDYFSSVFSIPFHVWMSDDDFLYLRFFKKGF